MAQSAFSTLILGACGEPCRQRADLCRSRPTRAPARWCFGVRCAWRDADDCHRRNRAVCSVGESGVRAARSAGFRLLPTSSAQEWCRALFSSRTTGVPESTASAIWFIPTRINMVSRMSTVPGTPKDQSFWFRIPMFWRFQIGGWVAHFLYAYPLKWVTLEDWSDTFWVALYRDGLGFGFTLLMREIYRRVYRPGGRLWRSAFVAAGMSLLGAALITVMVLLFHHYLDFDRQEIFTTPMVFAIFYFQTGLFAVWSVLYFGIKSARDTAERNVSLAKTEASRQRAELQLLRAQMNPHFLYNALNTLTAEVGKPEQHLKSLIRALAEYLRYSLETRNEDRVPLGSEFDAVTSYLAVEKARFREKLEIESEIDPDARNALVPGIVIQPLVENAIKYGRKTSPRPLRIRVIVSKHESNRVQIEVSNTGEWVEPNPADTVGGVGLKNLRERLNLLYPNSHSFQIATENGWVVVRISIAET